MKEPAERKKGRPEGSTAKDPASHAATIRWRPADYERVAEAAGLCGVTVAKFIKGTAIIQAGHIIKDRKRRGA